MWVYAFNLHHGCTITNTLVHSGFILLGTISSVTNIACSNLIILVGQFPLENRVYIEKEMLALDFSFDYYDKTMSGGGLLLIKHTVA